jgi:hypothetical protein
VVAAAVLGAGVHIEGRGAPGSRVQRAAEGLQLAGCGERLRAELWAEMRKL